MSDYTIVGEIKRVKDGFAIENREQACKIIVGLVENYLNPPSPDKYIKAATDWLQENVHKYVTWDNSTEVVGYKTKVMLIDFVKAMEEDMKL